MYNEYITPMEIINYKMYGVKIYFCPECTVDKIIPFEDTLENCLSELQHNDKSYHERLHKDDELKLNIDLDGIDDLKIIGLKIKTKAISYTTNSGYKKEGSSHHVSIPK